MSAGGHIRFYDAHIHLDDYSDEACEQLLRELPGIGCTGVVAVSKHLASAKATRALARRYPDRIHPAYGFHPEQPLPADEELDRLFTWIRNHAGEPFAIGEIGLPYYTRKDAEKEGRHFDNAPYLRLLDRFLALAAELHKPVVLHAVYEDADAACDLLDKHGVQLAHFHWFKGSPDTVTRLIASGRYVSFTPDLLYEEEIQELARSYPPELTMAETDGPWPFEGPYAETPTLPSMAADVVRAWAALKGMTVEQAARLLFANTVHFYGLSNG